MGTDYILVPDHFLSVYGTWFQTSGHLASLTENSRNTCFT